MTDITRRSALAAIGAVGVAGLGAVPPALAAGAPIQLRCSIETPPHHARNEFVRQYLDMVAKASGGRIEPRLFESGALFADRDVPKALIQGQVEMGVPLTFMMANVVHDANVFELPICYGRTAEEVAKLITGPVGQEIARQFEQQLRVHVLGEWLPDGFQDYFTTKKPLNSYADLKGMTVRTAGGTLQFKRITFLGAIPVEVPWPEVPLGLSQGNFDALATVDDSAVAAKLWDAGLRYALEDHQELVQYVPIVSDILWEKLSPDLQKMMTDIWAQHIHAWQKKTLEDADTAVEKLKAAGVKIVIPPRSMVVDLRKAMLPYEDEWAKQAGIRPQMVKLANEAFGNQA
jgi:TRAP-type transport system periplasmic protein